MVSSPTAPVLRRPMPMIPRRAQPMLAAALAACASAAPPPAPAPAPVSGVAANGLAYDASGAGEPVVLIHAFSVDRRMWDEEARLLAGRHRVIRYDLRGHGGSPILPGGYSSTEDLAALLDELGIERAALVGLSAGARVALDFAVAHPDRVSRLVLAAPAVSGLAPRGSFDWMAPVIEAARAGDARLAAERWAETEMMSVPDAGRAARLRALVLDNASLWALPSNPERPLDPPALGRLDDVRAPTLVLVGARDLPDTHAAADTLAARLPGAAKRVVPGAGHMLPFAAPEAFRRALVEFLGER